MILAAVALAASMCAARCDNPEALDAPCRNLTPAQVALMAITAQRGTHKPDIGNLRWCGCAVISMQVAPSGSVLMTHVVASAGWKPDKLEGFVRSLRYQPQAEPWTGLVVIVSEIPPGN
jgi:hypothetical protein